MPIPDSPPSAPSSPAMRMPITIVNHVAAEIGAPVETVWQAILGDYVEAGKFRELGRVEPIDDPAAVLGGYRLLIDHDGVLDERVCHITELDHAARRLSLFADYLTFPGGGMEVWATYRAQESAIGARYTIDSHARLKIETQPGAAKQDIAAAIARMRLGADAALVAYLDGFKAKLEVAAAQ